MNIDNLSFNSRLFNQLHLKRIHRLSIRVRVTDYYRWRSHKGLSNRVLLIAHQIFGGHPTGNVARLQSPFQLKHTRSESTMITQKHRSGLITNTRYNAVISRRSGGRCYFLDFYKDPFSRRRLLRVRLNTKPFNCYNGKFKCIIICMLNLFMFILCNMTHYEILLLKYSLSPSLTLTRISIAISALIKLNWNDHPAFNKLNMSLFSLE